MYYGMQITYKIPPANTATTIYLSIYPGSGTPGNGKPLYSIGKVGQTGVDGTDKGRIRNLTQPGVAPKDCIISTYGFFFFFKQNAAGI